ncbi:glutamine-synthetase adenylyltransferase [Qipengyuania atrilutea]|uniref:Glutamine-synthetase adenylyltransferase n=1 Tax=Qipengyuania atrilutea TaxID=2744473 RepID=A0A850H614_9SPHN|nr:glutamine-synthetase adenylyltransferase [Actirhodobacter atriluteus]NVD44595.1 glutamine-synthetase adenylyltransferase [Actirhodobacter atriluteus]
MSGKTDENSAIDDAIRRAKAHSPFLFKAMERLPELTETLRHKGAETAVNDAKAVASGVEDAAKALRQERLAIAMVLGIGDLAGAFDLTRVMRELSDFADRAMHRALEAVVARRVEGAEPDGIFALALGKLGARELNYSSDIDPILIYDPSWLPKRERDEPGEAAQRYAREWVRMLSDNTAEGYVARVDLRLRPASEISPLAVPLGGALSHYESSALAWERAAFIRARSAAGDIAAGEEFLDQIDSFVWRRTLDFGAIDEIRRLTHRIRETYKGPSEPSPGFNLKQGRGGIREIEFFAQTHQLVHGGRDPSLRESGTRAALDALAAAGRITGEDARLLGESYDKLRTIEHRLQMVADQQTHSLPAGEALDNVAKLHGLTDGAALLAYLTPICAGVAERFDRLIAEDSEPARSGEPQVDSAVLERISNWADGRYRALRSDAALSAFGAMRGDLLSALSAAPDPERAVTRLESLIERLPSAINLFRLLEARPAMLGQLVRIVSLAPPLADELARRPELLDPLIDNSAFALPGPVARLAAKMGVADTDEDDYEERLDCIRVVTGETRFTLGVQLIEAAHDPLDIAAGLSRTAEAGLEAAQAAATREFAETHGRIEGSELVVLALGRLGGGLLTHASDLDIVYLFSGTHEAESDGRRPLGATLYFNRLAQRVTAALSVPTAEGALYEVDTRLRPQGNQGPIAVSFESFARYQREAAWTWEHMALTRARAVTGPEHLREELDALVAEVLTAPRDAANLKQAVLTMRSDMAQHKTAAGVLDAKLLRGGLVDLEFLTHYLQLRERTALEPEVGEALSQLGAAGILKAEDADELREANALLNRVLIAARLLAPDLSRPHASSEAVLAHTCGADDWNALLDKMGSARHSVARHWKAVFGDELEIET